MKKRNGFFARFNKNLNAKYGTSTQLAIIQDERTNYRKSNNPSDEQKSNNHNETTTNRIVQKFILEISFLSHSSSLVCSLAVRPKWAFLGLQRSLQFICQQLFFFLKCQFLLNNFVEQQSCFVALVVVFEVIGLQLRFKALNAALNLIRYAHIK